ncbi:MAG: nicotinamidase/pyrazinamidase [Chloroflexota bacterium]|nr:nicotinamidase/pyrazinamidase [Chloroflexota bacterium]
MATYDARTALIVVDVQNDFADPKGSLSVAGGEDVVPYVNEQVARALEAGASVVYSQDWHPATTPHFRKDGGDWPVHCVRDTWGAELHPDLLVDGPIVRKGTNGEDGYSAFSMRDQVTGETTPTELAALLGAAGVERLVVCGLATDYCVLQTALDARHLGFPTSLLVNGIRAVDVRAGDGERAVAEMRAAGVEVDETA